MSGFLLAVFTPKGKADYYEKHGERDAESLIVKLPSTRPANAAWSLERLVGVWGRNLLDV